MSIDSIISEAVSRAVKELYATDTPADSIVPQACLLYTSDAADEQ